MPDNPTNKVPTQIFDNIPKDDVGTSVQDYIDDDATKVTITPNDDGKTYTVEVEKQQGT